ncbi:MAG: endopeptidase La [Bacilli bacterium]|nr:endopeptidase La [Bacilli bacterium]
MDYTLLVMMLKDLVILPFQEIKLELKDEISKKIIKVSSKKYDNRVLILSPRNSKNNDPSIEDLPNVGVVAYIKNKIELSNGNLRVTLKGEKRVKILDYESFSSEIIDAVVTDIILPKLEEAGEKIIRKKLKEILNDYINSAPNISNSILKTVNENDDLNLLTDAITTFLPLSTSKKLDYMQQINCEKRALSLIRDIKLEIKYAKLEAKIDNNVQVRLSLEQEEYYLKEKIKEIENTLGLKDNSNEEIKNYYDKLDKLKLSDKTHNKLLTEIKKLENASINSPENSVIRSYLDWVLNLPWNNSSKETLTVKPVLNSLNKSHYGLDIVKERIEDYINVKNINPNISSPIICLVGPPGVGKTTITKSIAEALNREFYKVSVGGLNDSTELVGNRRTYLGALPGKIIQGLKKCNTNNPVILIDEVDKMVKDYKGDPASTLLDILDSTQNKQFVDNYIEEPFDLSNVFFVLTANNIENIPYTLYDRLEIIELSSYTVFEKIDIAKKYILPKIYEEFGLSKKLVMKDETLIYLINNYTKESGVRNLTRVLRTLVTKVVTSKSDSYTVSNIDLMKYLKDPIVNIENKEISESGIVNALAYTPLGGINLQIECSIYNGEEKILVTGSLGDVLKESIHVATSFIKEKNYVSNTMFYNHTIHIHLLDGATKKEGPSCGVAITTVILSKLLDIKVSEKIAFTGEISLKGNILRVGGLKEKLIAAYNAGIETVYVPEDNSVDLKDIPKQIIENVDIKLVNNFDTIYNDLFKINEEENNIA